MAPGSCIGRFSGRLPWSVPKAITVVLCASRATTMRNREPISSPFCTHGRVCIFGDILNGEMVVNACGQRVTEEWLHTGLLRPDVVVDAFVVMPNHLHGIVIITERDHHRGVLRD